MEDTTVPDLIMIGTSPLTLYGFVRAVHNGAQAGIFAVLAGFCAGITAFISVYIFAVHIAKRRYIRPCVKVSVALEDSGLFGEMLIIFCRRLRSNQ